MNRKAKKLILLGWDAADWKIIHPLLDSGQMPALKRLIENGVMGNIATLDPPLSPMLWTSIATGKTADKHGILGFAEPDPNTGKVRPVSVTSRNVKAIWNILAQNNIKSHVVGWWPSHPAEPIDGVYVSNQFAKPRASVNEPWPLTENCIHPKSLEDTLAQLRVHPGELSFAHLIPFVPEAIKIDQEKDKSLASIAALLANGSSLHAAATWILQNQEWEFLALYLNEIDLFSHTFMRFHPPKMEDANAEQYELYKNVINSAYRFHDMMLERLMELAGPDATFVLVSDHGFHSDHLRPRALPDDPAAPALEHAPYGIFCVSGPAIKKDERVFGATLLNITPTILHLFGLPVGRDMDGQAHAEILEEIRPVEFIDSWESIAGSDGQHAGELREDPWAAQEALKQLVDLGYIEALDENDTEAGERVRRESRFYLARVFLSTRRVEQAVPILEELYAAAPDTFRYGLRLAFAYQQLNRTADTRRIVDALRKLDRQARNMPQLDFLEGSILFSENKPRRALEFLRKAENSVAHLPGLHMLIGQVYIATRNWHDAERAYIRALAIDSENARAHHGLALAALRQDKFEIAIDEALNAVGLLFQFPGAHYHLGEALYKTGDYERAAHAFSVCVAQMPGARRAHTWLADLYKNKLNQPEKAAYHQTFVAQNIRGTIYIVSGLPRSGTSMMMQMLRAGGLEIMTDNLRVKDENNPHGYLEDDRVKRIHQDNSWVKNASGKALKVVAPLLQFLPQTFRYKIMYMQRDLNEVISSQQKMIGQQKAVTQKVFPVTMADAMHKQSEKAIAWIKAQPHVEVMYVNYTDVIASPLEQAENIALFINDELDPVKMVEAVQENLYRNRNQQTN